MSDEASRCQWVSLREALTTFVLAREGTQGSGHIRPLHWHVACRLVVEGGFHPADITPRPPFAVQSAGSGPTRRHRLEHDPTGGGVGERTILGGLKTKDVDVVIHKDGIGPCVAISLKGMLNAYRNLTNRMEEAVGDCTNLHITYPALVYGFLIALRANRAGPVLENGAHFLKADERGSLRAADIALREAGTPAESIIRFHQALAGLADRKGVRNDFTRYEAVALALVDPAQDSIGEVIDVFPPEGSPLLVGDFFQKIYHAYDQRFVYGAPALTGTTRRLEWSSDSPALADRRTSEYQPRVDSD